MADGKLVIKGECVREKEEIEANKLGPPLGPSLSRWKAWSLFTTEGTLWNRLPCPFVHAIILSS